MTPFIAVCVLFILLTMIMISFHKIPHTDDSLPYSRTVYSHAILTLDPHQQQNLDELDSILNLQTHLELANSLKFYDKLFLKIRYLIAFHKYEEAENELRTLYLFFPDNPEIVGLLTRVLTLQKKTNEANYYREQLLFLQNYYDMHDMSGDNA